MILNSEVYGLLGQLDGWTMVDDKKIPNGLLNENTGLGLKRRLRKIQKELIEKFQELQKDNEEIEKIEDKDKKEAELKTLLEEGFELKAEKVLMSEIEKISSEFNYNFDLLDKISQ